LYRTYVVIWILNFPPRRLWFRDHSKLDGCVEDRSNEVQEIFRNETAIGEICFREVVLTQCLDEEFWWESRSECRRYCCRKGHVGSRREIGAREKKRKTTEGELVNRAGTEGTLR
jgi:hypothetical protein